MTDRELRERAEKLARRIRLHYTDDDGIVRIPWDRFDDVATDLIASALAEERKGRWVSVETMTWKRGRQYALGRKASSGQVYAVGVDWGERIYPDLLRHCDVALPLPTPPGGGDE